MIDTFKQKLVIRIKETHKMKDINIDFDKENKNYDYLKQNLNKK